MSAIAERNPAKRENSGSTSFRLCVLGIVLFAVISCYFRLFIFPDVPLLPSGDALWFFVSGSRIVANQLPYRDFFEILPVGSDLCYALLIKVFGFSTFVPNLTMVILAAGVISLTTLCARHVLQGAIAVIPALLIAGFAFSNETLNATHHWFCTAAAMAAIAVLLGGITPARVLTAGVFIGLAACFTQTTGATVCAALMLYFVFRADNPRVRRQNVLLLISVAAGVFILVNGYFVRAAGLGNWFFCMFVFPLHYFGVPDFNNWRVIWSDFHLHRSFERWIYFPFVYCSIPRAYYATFSRLRFSTARFRLPERDRLMLILTVGLGMLVAIAPAPSLLRLSSASPPAMILLVWLFDRDGVSGKRLNACFAAAAAIVAIAVPLEHQLRWNASLDLPGGRTAFLDRIEYEEYRWLLERIHPGDYVFGKPAMYPSFHIRNPAPVALFDISNYTRPQQVEASIRSFDQHHLSLVVTKLRLDKPPAAEDDHTGPFRTYVRAHFHLEQTFGNGDAIWEANQNRSSRVADK